MIDPLKLSAAEILAIAQDKPEKLFSKDLFTIQLKRMRSLWHPDKSSSPQAEVVFQHLMILAKTAEDRIRTDTWAGRASIQFTLTRDSKTYRFRYLASHPFELGNMYIGSKFIVYIIDEKYENLYENGVKMMERIKYPRPSMKEEFSKFLPKIKLKGKSNLGFAVVIEKPEGTVLLQDLINFVPDKNIPPKHVAWITGALYNILTFLDYIDICHNSVLPSTIFIDPIKHGIFLLGGWWYASKTGDTLKVLPSDLIKILPKELFEKKVAKTSYDRLAAKGVAIGCLGDSTLVGSKLLTRKDIPAAMLTTLRLPSNVPAVQEYQGWDNAMVKSFGKRKFVKFDVNVDKIYE